MTYAAFTDLSGKTIRWDSDNTAAIVPLAEELANPVARSRILSGSGASTVVLGTALATATALGLNVTAATLPVIQAVSGPTTLGGANAYVVKGQAPEVQAFALPDDLTAYSRIAWADGSVLCVVGAPAAVAAAIVGTGGATASRLVLQAIILGSNGTIINQVSDVGVTLAATVPYTPGTGAYQWSLSGANTPTGYIVDCGVLSGGPAAFDCSQTGIGSPDFTVVAKATSKVFGGARVFGTTGNVDGEYGAVMTKTGVGVYDVDLNATATVPTKWNLVPSVNEAVANTVDLSVVYASATKATVSATLAGVAADVDWSYDLVALEVSGNGGSIAAEPIYTLQVFSAD